MERVVRGPAGLGRPVGPLRHNASREREHGRGSKGRERERQTSTQRILLRPRPGRHWQLESGLSRWDVMPRRPARPSPDAAAAVAPSAFGADTPRDATASAGACMIRSRRPGQGAGPSARVDSVGDRPPRAARGRGPLRTGPPSPARNPITPPDHGPRSRPSRPAGASSLRRPRPAPLATHSRPWPLPACPSLPTPAMPGIPAPPGRALRAGTLARNRGRPGRRRRAGPSSESRAAASRRSRAGLHPANSEQKTAPSCAGSGAKTVSALRPQRTGASLRTGADWHRVAAPRFRAAPEPVPACPNSAQRDGRLRVGCAGRLRESDCNAENSAESDRRRERVDGAKCASPHPRN